jgi:hypothetical protein
VSWSTVFDMCTVIFAAPLCMLGLSTCRIGQFDTRSDCSPDYGVRTHKTSSPCERLRTCHVYFLVVCHYSVLVRSTNGKIGSVGRQCYQCAHCCMSLYRGSSKMFHMSAESFLAVILKVWHITPGQGSMRTLLPSCCKSEGKMYCIMFFNIFQNHFICSKGVAVSI